MAKILDLKLQLQTSKKGGASCAEFLQHMEVLADRLRSIGVEVSDQDLVLHTLQGLGSDYESFVTALSMRLQYPSMIEMSNLLLAHENRLLTNLKSSSSTSVNLTTSTPASDQSTQETVLYTNYKAENSSSNRGRSNQQRGRGYGRGRGKNIQASYQSASVSQNSDPSQIQCQICSKWGHAALDCYHRFDIRFIASSAQP
jgi:gag-polypeptide of LTR copia-type